MARPLAIPAAAGINFYEGAPCRRCGTTIRYANSKQCVSCTRMRSRGEPLPEIQSADESERAASVEDEPLPPPRSNARCRHGRLFREHCHACEVAWYRRPRTELPAIEGLDA